MKNSLTAHGAHTQNVHSTHLNPGFWVVQPAKAGAQKPGRQKDKETKRTHSRHATHNTPVNRTCPRVLTLRVALCCSCSTSAKTHTNRITEQYQTLNQTTKDHTTQNTKPKSTHHLKLPTTDGSAYKVLAPLTTELWHRLTHVTDAFSTHHWHLRSNDLRCLLTAAAPCRPPPSTQPQLLSPASVRQ